jgi:hypothetical protein
MNRGTNTSVFAGQNETAIELFEELSSLQFRCEHSHTAALQSAYFDPLRDDPRFQALVANWEWRECGVVSRYPLSVHLTGTHPVALTPTAEMNPKSVYPLCTDSN